MWIDLFAVLRTWYDPIGLNDPQSSHDNHGPSPKIDFVKERILPLLFSQHQGLNRSIRLPRCNALWPQNEQSWDLTFTPKCPYIPIHNKSSQESAGTHPKHVFSKTWNTCQVITLGRACCMHVFEWFSVLLFWLPDVAQAPNYCQHQFGRKQSCRGETAGRTVQHEHCP